MCSRVGFGNVPSWRPGILSREEERGHWVHKVCCLDLQIQCLEQASFYSRLAMQSDIWLQTTCLQAPLQDVTRVETREDAPRRGEEPPASGAKQSFQSVFPLPADAIVHQSVNVETGSGSLPAQTERGSARTLGCVDGKEPKLEDFELAILEHQAILHYDGGDGKLRVD